MCGWELNESFLFKLNLWSLARLWRASSDWSRSPDLTTDFLLSLKRTRSLIGWNFQGSEGGLRLPCHLSNFSNLSVPFSLQGIRGESWVSARDWILKNQLNNQSFSINWKPAPLHHGHFLPRLAVALHRHLVGRLLHNHRRVLIVGRDKGYDHTTLSH